MNTCKKFMIRVDNAICRRLIDAADEIKDKKICGQSLVKYVPSVFRDDKNGIGSTGSQSTSYVILKRIFSHVELKEEDNFIDVGCGKGRVLAYLIDQKCPCSLHGIEINPESGKIAVEWTKKYDNVTVEIGDAFLIDYDRYSVLFLGRPFLPKTFLSFIEKLESTVTHPITFIYWVDQQSGYLLKDRPGWNMQFREVLRRINGIRIAYCPQSYSVWTYKPKKTV